MKGTFSIDRINIGDSKNGMTYSFPYIEKYFRISSTNSIMLPLFGIILSAVKLIIVSNVEGFKFSHYPILTIWVDKYIISFFLTSFILLAQQQFLFLRRSVKTVAKIDKILPEVGTEYNYVRIYFSYDYFDKVFSGECIVIDEKYSVGQFFDVFIDRRFNDIFSHLRLYPVKFVFFVQFISSFVAILSTH
jgi:hypothetical protein